ncbi:MAG: glycoside hydrolase family 36 protein [Propionibacteriaceae bacterium]
MVIDRPALHPALTGATARVVRASEQACSYGVTVSEAGSWDPQIGYLELPNVQKVFGFTSSWGLEFQPVQLAVDEPSQLEVTSGRSTQGAVPWLAVDTADGWYVVTVHWSGNWRLSLTPADGATTVTIALHPEGQQVVLGEDEVFTLPEVSVGWGATRLEAAAALARHLAGQTPSGPPLLTEWNHWWPYEDAEINEDVFLDNAAIAADLGLDVAVLDAGWFGRAEADSDWVAERGDWHLVNTARFPHGLAWLADETRARGLDFGIWIEAEAVGHRATIADSRPELLALGPDQTPLGYVCLGSPGGEEHLYRTVAALITTTRARWIKWDFNLDPGRGCTRSDHGHRPEEGLLRHYLGLYRVLDRLRVDHPDTVFEACSSGGLRIDAGLAAHVDAFFLSDPDWTEHHLTCLWGAAQLLPPRQLLHWPQSEWRGEHRFQKADYSGTLMTPDQFDTKMRAAMLHRFGVSVRLTEMRPELRERLGRHLQTYRDVVRPLVESGILIPLTDQPLREEQGHRQPAFQLSSGDEHLIAGFRLPPTGDWEAVRPFGLDENAEYAVRRLDGSGSPSEARSGRQLVDDGLVADTRGATSVMWQLSRVG